MKSALVCLLSFSLSTFAVEHKEEKKTSSIAGITSGNTKSVMMIDPKARAEDFIKAFEKLRNEIPPQKIYFHIIHTKPLNNILSLSLMENGTLLIFRIANPSGAEYKIIPIEDVLEITHM